MITKAELVGTDRKLCRFRADLQGETSFSPRSSTLFHPGMSSVCVPRTRCFLRQVFPGLPAVMRRHYSLDVAAPLLRTQGYVNGRWVSAASVFPVVDPATGQEIAQVSDCGPAEAKQAVDAAYEAFQSWKQRSAKVASILSLTALGSKNCQIKFLFAHSTRKSP